MIFMNKFLKYGTIAAVAMASVPNFAQAQKYYVSGMCTGPDGRTFRFSGWVDPFTGHGYIGWDTGWVSWYPTNTGDGDPLHHVDNLLELMSDYVIDAKNTDVSSLNLDQWGDFIVDVYNQSVDQAGE